MPLADLSSGVLLARTVGRAATRKNGHAGERCSLHPEDPVQAEDLEAIYAVRPTWWMCPREVEGAECQDLAIDPPCQCRCSPEQVVKSLVRQGDSAGLETALQADWSYRRLGERRTGFHGESTDSEKA